MANPNVNDKVEQLFQNDFLQDYLARFSGGVAPDAPFLRKLGNKMYGNEAAARKAFDDTLVLMKGQSMGGNEAKAKVLDLYEKLASDPFNSKKVDLGNLTHTLDNGTVETVPFSKTALGNTAGIAGRNIMAHPGAAFGTALNTGAGIAGLLDNDKFGGQLIGTAAGAIIPKIAGMKLGPLGAYNTAMIAGNLGALFDNLRAKKEQQQQHQYYDT